MQIAAAQEEMAGAHVRGAPGVFVSGLVWLIAGWLWGRYGVVNGFYGLFVGGILISPGSLLLSRVFFRAPKAPPGNPLERLALESTFILFGGTLLAYCFLRVAPELAFPAMAVSIGVRYLVFRTIYGNLILVSRRFHRDDWWAGCDDGRHPSPQFGSDCRRDRGQLFRGHASARKRARVEQRAPAQSRVSLGWRAVVHAMEQTYTSRT